MALRDDGRLEQHRTARHLDDPTALVLGLSFPQLLGVVVGGALSYWLWGLTSAAGTAGLAGETRLFLVLGLGIAVAAAFYLQFRGKTEPFVPQIVRFALRAKRFRAAWIDRDDRT